MDKAWRNRLFTMILAACLLLMALPVTVNAAGNYQRISGAERYETSRAAAEEILNQRGAEQFHAVILASGSGFADALSGSSLAGVTDAPILLYSEKQLVQLSAYLQRRLHPEGTVYLLGGTAAISQSAEAAFSDYKLIRLGGENRYETNLKILEQAGIQSRELLVCSGKGFADSLSVSCLGKPVLLVGEELTPLQRQFLQQQSWDCVIIGGEGAVNTGWKTNCGSMAVSAGLAEQTGMKRPGWWQKRSLKHPRRSCWHPRKIIRTVFVLARWHCRWMHRFF